MLVSTGPGIRAAVRPPSVLVAAVLVGTADAALPELDGPEDEDAGGVVGAGPPSAAASDSDNDVGGTMMERANRVTGFTFWFEIVRVLRARRGRNIGKESAAR